MDDWGPERLRRLFAPAIDRARELGLQLHCGEFGIRTWNSPAELDTPIDLELVQLLVSR